MSMFLPLMLAGALLAPSPSPHVSTISQAFSDRAAQLDQRIASDQARRLLEPAQDALLRVQMREARRAHAAHDAAAPAMLDVIDRQLAQIDHTLSRAEDGGVLTVHVGDAVIVALHDAYTWNVTNSDRTVLAPKIGVMWVRGVQGGFTAKRPGTAMLTLTARSSVPPNVKQPVVFTIVVLPR